MSLCHFGTLALSTWTRLPVQGPCDILYMPCTRTVSRWQLRWVAWSIDMPFTTDVLGCHCILTGFTSTMFPLCISWCHSPSLNLQLPHNLHLTRTSQQAHRQLTYTSHGPHSQLTGSSHTPHTDLTVSLQAAHIHLTRTSQQAHRQLIYTSHGPHSQLTGSSHTPHTDLTTSSQAAHIHLTRTSQSAYRQLTYTSHGPHNKPTGSS